MENNTFSNREGLLIELPTLSATDTFSNKVALEEVLGIENDSTFSNLIVVKKAVLSKKKVVDTKDESGYKNEGAFKGDIKSGTDENNEEATTKGDTEGGEESVLKN